MQLSSSTFSLICVILELLDFSPSEDPCLADPELVSELEPILKPFKISISRLCSDYLRVHSSAMLDFIFNSFSCQLQSFGWSRVQGYYQDMLNKANPFQIQNRGKTSALVVEWSSMPTVALLMQRKNWNVVMDWFVCSHIVTLLLMEITLSLASVLKHFKFELCADCAEGKCRRWKPTEDCIILWKW